MIFRTVAHSLWLGTLGVVWSSSPNSALFQALIKVVMNCPRSAFTTTSPSNFVLHGSCKSCCLYTALFPNLSCRPFQKCPSSRQGGYGEQVCLQNHFQLFDFSFFGILFFDSLSLRSNFSSSILFRATLCWTPSLQI